MTCTNSYIGETPGRLSESVVNQASTHMKLHIVRGFLNFDHETVNIENFEIFNVELL